MKPNEQSILENLIRNRFAALDSIDLPAEGRMLINIAESLELYDLHTELCESYNQRTKTTDAEEAADRGMRHVMRKLFTSYNGTAA